METIPERFALTVNDARTCEGHVLLTDDVNERRGPQHFHTGDAGPYFRVIAERLASEQLDITADMKFDVRFEENRSEEHTSELQSLMRISYAVFCLKKKTNKNSHSN